MVKMARNYDEESEFGLGQMPSPTGGLIAEGATGAAAVTALTDADAIAAGAVGQEAGPVGSMQQLGAELREIYAQGEGTLGPGTTVNNF